MVGDGVEADADTVRFRVGTAGGAVAGRFSDERREASRQDSDGIPEERYAWPRAIAQVEMPDGGLKLGERVEQIDLVAVGRRVADRGHPLGAGLRAKPGVDHRAAEAFGVLDLFELKDGQGTGAALPVDAAGTR